MTRHPFPPTLVSQRSTTDRLETGETPVNTNQSATINQIDVAPTKTSVDRIRAAPRVADREPRGAAACIAVRIGGAVAALLMALGVTVGLVAAPAQAKTMFA